MNNLVAALKVSGLGFHFWSVRKPVWGDFVFRLDYAVVRLLLVDKQVPTFVFEWLCYLRLRRSVTHSTSVDRSCVDPGGVAAYLPFRVIQFYFSLRKL